MTDAKVVVALDFNNAQEAINFASKVDNQLCKLKVGKELFTAAGPELIHELKKRNFDVFLDLKFHDIPTTVAKALKAACDLGVWLVNVHALGGPKMLEAASLAVEGYSTKLIAVTILTSMDQAQLYAIGVQDDIKTQIKRLARLSYEANLDGVVCSAQEAAMIKDLSSSSFLTVTPGIRPAWSEKGDQMRIMTPSKAIQNRADYLVIGRPITQHQDPLQALQLINEEIAQCK